MHVVTKGSNFRLSFLLVLVHVLNVITPVTVSRWRNMRFYDNNNNTALRAMLSVLSDSVAQDFHTQKLASVTV